ncbi:Translationally-controlled tumor protein [Penicillium citrinum]|uniref:Translationally-controlled tumor protein homolog n=2 Tax=Penicillium TaxID=5073 RepID=A0A9W9PE34_PENCI|nr:Translationally-controlled tumor protein [Penicillium citrinum]KAJ5241603.1 Translationally-controlled tumor protein [Penicillium citrinum]KAJ5586612.1 Translationally-controlled tumor protein [Penicillium hetheringtonii]
MIIYEDIISGDEILSDTFKITPAKDCPILWETDCRKYLKKGNEDFQLEGANPSAEEAEEAGGEGEAVMVHDIEDQFRLVWLKPEEGLKPSKDAFKAHLKSYVKKVLKKLEENGAPAEAIAEFKSGAPTALKKITANYDNYDVLMGQSMDGDAMHVLIDFREDGVTPFATVWKHGFKEVKV